MFRVGPNWSRLRRPTGRALWAAAAGLLMLLLGIAATVLDQQEDELLEGYCPGAAA